MDVGKTLRNLHSIIMRKIQLALVATVMTASGLSAQGAPSRPQGEPPRPKAERAGQRPEEGPPGRRPEGPPPQGAQQRQGQHEDQFGQRPELSDAQRTQVMAIRERYRAQHLQLQAAEEREIKTILTPEQRERVEARIKAMQQQGGVMGQDQQRGTPPGGQPRQGPPQNGQRRP